MLLTVLAFLVPLFSAVEEVQTLAYLACGEAGGVEKEASRVLRVVYNRANKRNTTPYAEATRPYQFYLKGCKGKRSVWLRRFHFSLALSTFIGTIKAPEKGINSYKTTHFATTSRLDTPHPRCVGYTIREVWYFSGLTTILRTGVGHEFFKQTRKYRPGCPTVQVGM